MTYPTNWIYMPSIIILRKLRLLSLNGEKSMIWKCIVIETYFANDSLRIHTCEYKCMMISSSNIDMAAVHVVSKYFRPATVTVIHPCYRTCDDGSILYHNANNRGSSTTFHVTKFYLT